MLPHTRSHAAALMLLSQSCVDRDSLSRTLTHNQPPTSAADTQALFSCSTSLSSTADDERLMMEHLARLMLLLLLSGSHFRPGDWLFAVAVACQGFRERRRMQRLPLLLHVPRTCCLNQRPAACAAAAATCIARSSRAADRKQERGRSEREGSRGLGSAMERGRATGR